MNLTIQADLNPLFNWNVKQLFLYLTAEYQTPNNKLNQVEFKVHTCRFKYLQKINERFQVVLWDKIILRGENAMLDYRRYLKVS